ncbi:DUF4147 domain-containing protein [Galactobacillus timonensis]|uniref:glycerate kinase type-2 family protein n=1 Tax=Galactobacillus timonensis TaxID=2041840 RepID=UPI002409F1A3|nr:DUF4147 domain-containing protein [Galactobacillus timonensis]MDD6369779.1 DUF4147 domain-containing protein [Galactobacillus timonensis]
MIIQEEAMQIIETALHDAKPDEAVKRALADLPEVSGKIVLVSFGKAAWSMSAAAEHVLGDKISEGICITKYGHVQGKIPHVTCYEAGHPVPDENSFSATWKAEALVHNLSSDDLVLLLVSGGGSALFEDPLIAPQELQDITKQLLACGADITEINIIRKRLSDVKGGKFAEKCRPARVFSIVLSDIIGDPLDSIASGPAYPDSHTCQEALAIADKYALKLSDRARSLLNVETPKQLDHVETRITGSVRQLCRSAENECIRLGYQPVFLTSSLNCEAKEAGGFLASIARDHQNIETSTAWILGGETIVHLHGSGLGGRNQELVLSAAAGIGDCHDTCIFSIGSDGTDGPTDAAGGIVDEHTCDNLKSQGISISSVLADNDSYHALKRAGALVVTGPTGTNVNDLTVLLIKRKAK